MIRPTEDDIGRAVVYHSRYMRENSMPAEEGVITSFNDKIVFVRYGSDKNSKGTYPESLRWATPDRRRA